MKYFQIGSHDIDCELDLSGQENYLNLYGLDNYGNVLEVYKYIEFSAEIYEYSTTYLSVFINESQYFIL